jgi:hypothetical protein
MPAIKTPFDGTIDEDVQLEQVNGAADIETILANSENVYKAFLYLRKMYSIFPQRVQTLGAFTGSSSDYTVLNIPKNVNRIIVKNLSTDSNLMLRFNNSDEYAILPQEKEEIAIIATTDDVKGTKVEYNGNISVRFVVNQEF